MRACIVVDIGNSTVSLTAYADERRGLLLPGSLAVTEARAAAGAAEPLFRVSMKKEECVSVERFTAFLSETAELHGLGGEGVVSVALCSVVPALSAVAEKAACQAFAGEIFHVDSRAYGGLRLHYDKPETLGPDRLAAAAGGACSHPGTNLVVVDMGTATTVDAVSAAGVFLGGFIVPGPGTWLASLASNTALLPAMDPSAGDGENHPAIGSNSAACIANGLALAYPALIHALVSNIRDREFAGAPATVIATGGWSRRFALACFDVTDRDLVARGALSLLFCSGGNNAI